MIQRYACSASLPRPDATCQLSITMLQYDAIQSQALILAEGYADRSCAAFKYVDKTIDTMLMRSERDMTAEQS